MSRGCCLSSCCLPGCTAHTRRLPTLFFPLAAVGTVNKVGADYVGLLVLGVVNASIAADQMRPEFRPRLAVSTGDGGGGSSCGGGSLLDSCTAATGAPFH